MVEQILTSVERVARPGAFTQQRWAQSRQADETQKLLFALLSSYLALAARRSGKGEGPLDLSHPSLRR